MDFDYNIDLTDKTIELIEMQEDFYNYSESMPHIFDQSYESLYYDIKNDEVINLFCWYPFIGFDKKYVQRSFNIWKELGVNLHDLNIAKRFKNIDKLDKIDNKFYKSFFTGDPSKLRLKYSNRQSDSKIVNLEVDFSEYKGLIFKTIYLPRLEKKLVSGIYAHEMTHAQLLSRDGGTNSIFNEEMIPIFMEYVFASVQSEPETNLFYTQSKRLMSICNILGEIGLNERVPFSRRIECEVFIISTIQAIKLFDIYYHSNDEIKKEILNDISRLFDGEIIIEDIIAKYDVFHEKIPKDIKQLKISF